MESEPKDKEEVSILGEKTADGRSVQTSIQVLIAAARIAYGAAVARGESGKA